MQLKDAKIGDKVLIFVYKNSKSLIQISHEDMSGCYTVPATIVDQNCGGTKLGWKISDDYPISLNLVVPYHLLDTIDIVQEYGSHCYCLPINVNYNDSINNFYKIEKPCKQCKRNNDLNINKCWWCCVDNPTI